ncbi:MAG TPA: M28 family peptidase, partial [Candidatus Polarisedimenticolia bacterium]|nr:M28 family peptidase [Candidatus Polarisedimenticolia bacterium]
MLIYARSSVKKARDSMPLRTARPAALTLLLAAAFAPLALGGDARAAFDGARALRDVLQLAGAIGPRKTGTEGDRRAVDYVRREMEAAGLAVTLQPVERLLDDDGERSIGSWNVIGRLDGDAPDTILVAAHHDSRGVLVPGANDDASGLAVLLEAARAASARPRRLSYLFVSFCAEEEDLLGSRS